MKRNYYQLLGYKIYELTKNAVEEYEMQNKLMTKAEAIEAHAKTQANSMMEYYDVTQHKSKLFVEGLEALGLIEFKEEEKELSTKITEAGLFGITEETVLKVMAAITRIGYKIVSK